MEFENRKIRRKPLDIATMALGKVPPQAKDLEEAILGAILLEKSAFDIAIQKLKPEYFYVEAHQRIYKAMQSLAVKSLPIDLLTVVEELKLKEDLDFVGGHYFVTKLTNAVVSSANIETHLFIVLQKFIQRELIKISSEIISDAYADNTDVFDMLNEAEDKLKEINIIITGSKKIDVDKIALDVVSSLTNKSYNARNNIENPDDVFTGLKEWDEVNGPLFNGLYIVAARPGMGKSNHMVEVICKAGKKIRLGIMNGEMTNKQLLTRIGCNLKSIDNYLWKKNPINITDDELKLVHDSMEEATSQLNIVLDNHTDINKVANKIKLWVEQDGVKLILLDVLSKYKVSEEKKRYMTDLQELNYVLNQLDNCAKNFGVPIIVYAHLNRELYKRGSKEPNLSDLKGSGNIEDFAFQVSFLHRPEYYEPSVLTDEMGENIKGLCYQIIAKHRDGELKRLKYKAILQCSQMKEWENNIKFFPKGDTPF